MVHRSVVRRMPIHRIAQFAALLAGLLLPTLLQAQTTASLTPSSVAFGAVVENKSSNPKTVVLKNTGSHQLNTIHISISGAFSQTHSCGSSLAPGASCNIFVTFTPTGTGPFSGTLTVTDSATNSPQTASLSGSGVLPVALIPSSLTFSNQVVGTTSAGQTVTVKNNQSTAVTISNISTTGDFAQGNNCPGSLGSQATCTVTVTFTPTATGTRTGTLSVTDSAPDNPTASLTGFGINTPVPASFFGLDVNQNNSNDPWPGTGAASSFSFSTYRTLGSSIKWNDLYDCTTTSYVFEGSGASSNNLLTWAGRANSNGQSIMFTAYYTPDCLVPPTVQTQTGTTFCAFYKQMTVSSDHEYYGCDLPGDVGSGDATFKTFLTDLLTYLTDTTYFPNQWPTIYIEVWNEPNVPHECDASTGNCAVGSLAQMVADAKSVASGFTGQNIKIISPAPTANQPSSGDCTGTAETINVYLNTLLMQSPSVATNADYIGFHGYVVIPPLLASGSGKPDPAVGASCDNDLINNPTDGVRYYVSQYTSKPLFDTEDSWGANCTTTGCTYLPNSWINGLTQTSSTEQVGAEQAGFTGQDYLIHASNNSTCPSTFTTCNAVDGLSWYGWDFDNMSSDPGSTGQFWYQWTNLGGPGFTPAGIAYKVLYSWLNGSSPSGPCTSSTGTAVGVWTCYFYGPGTSAGLAVWDNSQTCVGMGTTPCTFSTYNFPANTYTEWRDLYGDSPTQLSGLTSVSIGLVPILLDNGTEPAAPPKGQKAAGGSPVARAGKRQ